MSTENGQRLQESLMAMRRSVVVAISNKKGRKVPPQAIESLDSGVPIEKVVSYALEHGKKKRRSISSKRPQKNVGQRDQRQKHGVVRGGREVSKGATQTAIVSGRGRSSLLIVAAVVIMIILLATATYFGWPYLAEVVDPDLATR